MKKVKILFVWTLILVQLCGCMINRPVETQNSSSFSADTSSQSSSRTSSCTSSDAPSSAPEVSSSSSVPVSSAVSAPVTDKSSSAAAFSSDPVESAVNQKQDTAPLAKVLSALQRTGASDTAQQQGQAFAGSAAKSLPKSAHAVLRLLALCSNPENPDGLSDSVTDAVKESGIAREMFQLAAAACRERGRKTADTVTLTFTGDCTFSPINEESHSNSFDQVYTRQKSASYPFDRMFPWFATDDITCINFEGTLTKSLSHAEKKYYFRGDPSFAKILPSSSIELANLANNHTMDYFQKGYDDTKAALTSAGAALLTLQQPYITTVNGIQVVFIGQQTAYGASSATQTVKKYKRPNNIVIAVMHWSTEFSNEVAPACVTAGHNLIDAGADLVIGHHPHVLQGIELYQNKYIVYSLGNFAFGANVGQITSPYTMAFRARFFLKNGTTALKNAEIIPCNPTSDASGWNNYQPKPLFGKKARELADFVLSLSSSLPYGVKKLDYFDM